MRILRSMHELRTEPRQRRSQQSIDAILDAAERLIHKDGQVSFTANELATAADMSIGRVYYWFPDIPAVVTALAERAQQRLFDRFAEALSASQNAATPLLLQRTVNAMCDHLDQHPATVALCLTGGQESYGTDLQERMRDLVRFVVRARVVDVPDIEVEIVANTAVGIALGMLREYVAHDELRPILRDELVFVLSAWLYCRYPSSDDPVWHGGGDWVQPSRMPIASPDWETAKVYPALSPLKPD